MSFQAKRRNSLKKQTSILRKTAATDAPPRKRSIVRRDTIGRVFSNSLIDSGSITETNTTALERRPEGIQTYLMRGKDQRTLMVDLFKNESKGEELARFLKDDLDALSDQKTNDEAPLSQVVIKTQDGGIEKAQEMARSLISKLNEGSDRRVEIIRETTKTDPESGTTGLVVEVGQVESTSGTGTEAVTSTPALETAPGEFDNIVPDSFSKNRKSAIGYMDKNKLAEILPSYLPAKSDQEAVLRKWGDFVKEKNKTFQSVPQLIQFALGDKAANTAIERVKDNNKDASPAKGEGSTLFRGDSRTREQIIEANGLHGWGGSMSVDHARSWVTNVWNKMSNPQKGGWVQDWKAQTSSRDEALPFLATGWQAQKAGETFEINVPFQVADPHVTPKVVFDGESLETSTVIAITGRKEVIFLTGIPLKYLDLGTG